jgi:hypothetical protein
VYFPPNPDVYSRLAKALRCPDKDVLVRTGGEDSAKQALNFNSGIAGVPYCVIRDLFRSRERLDQDDVHRLLGLPEDRSSHIFQAISVASRKTRERRLDPLKRKKETCN